MKKHNPLKGLTIISLLAFTVFLFTTIFSEASFAQTQPNSAEYNTLIQQADKALTNKDYPTALMLYSKASYAKPELKYAAGKITEINTVLDADPDLKATLFETIIIQAEDLYKQKDYQRAKQEYQKSLAIDPSAQFPKDRLSSISTVYTDPSDLAYFNNAVANGDKALAASDYDNAILFYETALSVKPGTKEVKDKISVTKKQQDEYKLKTEQSAKIIISADKLLQAEKRTEARAEYQKALDLTPGNKHATQKIQEIDKYTNDKKTVQETYDKSIEQADQFYINRDFANARIKYQEALKAKPEARYPKEMLDKTKSGESQLQSDQQKYDAAIASAESLLSSGDYDASLIGFKSALAIKPAEVYPKNKITEIEKLISENTSRKEAFDIAIKNGDQAFDEKKYDPALSHYRNAISLMPGEKYPAQRVEEINTLIATQKTNEDNYKKTLTEADKLFAQNKYSESIIEYTKALALKPEEVYPQQKISEAQNMIAQAKNKDENYAAAIASGDNALAEQKYDDALEAYKQAINIKPAEKYPKDKSDEINKLLAKLKANADRYTLAVTNGDNAFKAFNYTLALSSYQEALSIKPEEKYPQERIAEIKSAQAAQQLIDENYLSAIKTGDQLFTSKNYDQALLAYSEAAGLKKSEKYPQEQIEKINKIVGEALTAQENYSQAINAGDENFNSLNYTEAIASYTRALKIKPAETYPKTQIDKINGLVAVQKKLEADYLAAIASADKLFGSQKYDEAIAGYQKALDLKPSEKYPSDKIAEAGKLIADIKALQESYDKAVADGDKLFTEKDFPNALVSFKSANTLKPAETYPKQKITEIQSIIDKDKAEGQRYQEAIAQADKLFGEQKYASALEPYQRASGIRPSEKYPQDQVAKVNQLLADQKKLDDDYQKLIADADAQFNAASYSDARGLYANAGTLKPLEKLPKDKISEIDGILAGMQQKEQNYSNAIKDGDNFFDDKKYTEAVNSYSAALVVKPSETYPKSQIDKINTILAEQKKLDDNYLTVLTSADKLFDGKQYAEAIADYRKALTMKPQEQYAAGKIAEAEARMAELKMQQETYEKAIAEGDKKFTEKDYENAMTAYKKANTTKPAEVYPPKKIAEIQVIQDKIKAENVRYQEVIALADKFFAGQKYLEALEPYQQALTIKPAEKYPQEQLTLINKLLDEQKKLETEYQTLITQAEAQFATKKYDVARSLFVNAGTMKPAETLPKERIAEIDRIQADLKAKDENYAKAINTASELYNTKKLPEAVKYYEEALTFKPDEKYPQDRIAAIKAEIKAINDNYSKAIANGDNKLAAKDLMEALNAYQLAIEIKPAEEYPKTKIAEINTLLAAQKEEQEKLYGSYLADGDKLMQAKDYSAAKSAFTKATGIKPAETYPKQKITEIDKIVEEIALARRAEYNKAIGEADKLYNTKIFDQAIDAYEAAAKINPGDSYPEQQIAKIRKYMIDHAIQDLFSQTLIIAEGNEKKFTFSALEPRLRKNNYILLKARSAGKTAPKVFLNYGKDNQKNGGIVLRSLDKDEISDYLIRISVQDKWYREDNNWISLFVESGEIEITKVQIAAGDE